MVVGYNEPGSFHFRGPPILHIEAKLGAGGWSAAEHEALVVSRAEQILRKGDTFKRVQPDQYIGDLDLG